MFHKREASISKPNRQDDYEAIRNRRDYNECVKEIKNETRHIGHFALQQEAIRRLNQKKNAETMEANANKPKPIKKRSGLDAIMINLSRKEMEDDDDDDDDSVGNKSHMSSGFESISSFFFGDDEDATPAGHRNHRPTLSSIGCLSTLFRDSASVRSFASSVSNAAESERVIRRRETVVARPEFSDSFNSKGHRHDDLELSDSDDSDEVMDNGNDQSVPQRGLPRNDSRRGLFTKRGGHIATKKYNHLIEDNDGHKHSSSFDLSDPGGSGSRLRSNRRASLSSLDEDEALSGSMLGSTHMRTPNQFVTRRPSFDDEPHETGSLICGWGHRPTDNSAESYYSDVEFESENEESQTDGNALICNHWRSD